MWILQYSNTNENKKKQDKSSYVLEIFLTPVYPVKICSGDSIQCIFQSIWP